MKKSKFILISLVALIFVVGLLIHWSPKRAIGIYHLFSMEEAPFWLQRLDQRQEVRTRVQSAGGWDVLRSDCSHLWQTNQDSHFFWNRWQTNQPALPPAIAALQPMFVEAYPPGVVDITLYGMGESRHRGIANYGLEVDCGQPMSPDEPRHYPARTYHKIADNIYENY